MSIEQKIAELLAESNAAELVAEDEEELDEEQIGNMLEQLGLQEASVEEIEDFMQTEDFQQIDELSKKTLGSYVKKASNKLQRIAANKKQLEIDTNNINKTNYDHERLLPAKTKNDLDQARDVVKKQIQNKKDDLEFKDHKRNTGIAKAVNRLTKEEYQLDISEDVAALTNGEDLSEEFKTKAATIFEAAVINRVKQEVASLEEEFDARLEEAVAQTQEALVEKVDGYLNYIVESWIAENEIALERGMKNEILESFVSGLKGLFEEHYIDVPEEKYDLIGEMEETIESLNNKLDEQLAANVDLKSQLDEAARMEIVASLSEGLADTEKEKFVNLVEELSFEDSDSFEKKVHTIRENYFTNKAHTKTITESIVTDEPVNLNEEKVIPADMKKYVNVLDNLK